VEWPLYDGGRAAALKNGLLAAALLEKTDRLGFMAICAAPWRPGLF